MSEKDYYTVLGVRRSASLAELRAAYVRQVKRHHPDSPQRGGLSSDRLGQLQAAYRCLSTPTARAEHDRVLDARLRLHFESQRAMRRSLRSYDHRHPPPKPPKRRSWKKLLLVACGAALAAQLSLHLLG